MVPQHPQPARSTPRRDTLLLLLDHIDRMPLPDLSDRPTRSNTTTTVKASKAGRKPQYSERLFLKASVIMTLKRLASVLCLMAVLEQPTDQMQALRQHLMEAGKLPTRRTFERRLARLASVLPAVIARLGAFLVETLDVWRQSGRAVAMDSTVLRAKDNAVWHKKHKEAGVVPHSRIDTQAGWTKSGWHGWVYGWKLHVSTAVGTVWLPVAARLTAADVHDGRVGETMTVELPSAARFVLGDQHYRTEEMGAACHMRGMELLATRGSQGKQEKEHQDAPTAPGTGPSVEVRRCFQQLRSQAIENFNEHFKAIFDSHADVPTKGKVATSRFALSAILTYQLGVWVRHELGLPLCQGLKPFLRAV